MNLVQSRLSTRRHRESSFQHWGGAVKLVPASLSAGKVILTIVATCEARVGQYKHQ